MREAKSRVRAYLIIIVYSGLSSANTDVAMIVPMNTAANLECFTWFSIKWYWISLVSEYGIQPPNVLAL